MPETEERLGNKTPIERNQGDSVVFASSLPPPPRRAVLNRDYWLGWLAMLFLLLLVPLLAYWWPESVLFLIIFIITCLMVMGLSPSRRKSKRFVTRGLVARGIIVTKNEIDIDDSIFSFDYSVAYDSSAGSHTLYFSGYDEYSVGNMVILLYLPERPGEAVLYEHCCHKAVENSNVSR